MRVNGEGIRDVLQVHEQLVAIEENQKELKDAIKDLTKEVKDVVVTLREEMSDIVASVKVMMLAIRIICKRMVPWSGRGK